MRASWKAPAATVAMTIVALLSAHAASAQQAARKPNILVILPAVAKVSTYLQTYKQFPPRQRPASFSIDQVIDKLQTVTKAK